MRDDYSRSTPVRGRPFYRVLMPAVAACFAGALLTDLTYWHTEDMQWANFSIWLITGGMVVGGLTLLAALVSRMRGRGMTVPAGVAFVALLVIGLLDALVHSRDAYTSVVPTGLTLSVLAVLALAACELLDRRPAPRRAVAVTA